MGVGYVRGKKRVLLNMGSLDWVDQLLSNQDVELLPISPRIAIQICRLPETPHGDLADRILISTAHEHSAVLVTHDQKIIEYGKGKFIDVFYPCI